MIYTALPYIIGSMQTVVETGEFLRCAKKIGMADDERSDLVSMLADNPQAGDEISGTGGMRKLRVAAKGKGKSGGYRVITFFSGTNIPVFLITAYAKSQKENITDKEKNILKSLSGSLVKLYRSKGP